MSDHTHYVRSHSLILLLLLLVAKKEILQIMSRAISKPRASRKENGPVVGKTLNLLLIA